MDKQKPQKADLAPPKLVRFSGNTIEAANTARPLHIDLIDNYTLAVKMEVHEWAYISFVLFDVLPSADAADIVLAIDVRGETGVCDLLIVLIDVVWGWHKPIRRRINAGDWQRLELPISEFLPHTDSYRVLKFVVEEDCDIKLRNLTISGLSTRHDEIHVVLPWFGRNPAHIRARDEAIAQLARQNRAFSLYLVELITDGTAPSFTPSQANHHHIVIHKDRTYEGVFHKESLLNYLLRTETIMENAVYVFLDADVYAQDAAWLQSILQALNDSPNVLLQPFGKVVDSLSGKTDYSWCKVQEQALASIAVNPGLCWAVSGQHIRNTGIGFSHRLATGIADAAFVARYFNRSDISALPYLPPFAWQDIKTEAELQHRHLDVELTHINHGSCDPRNYAMRDLLWQACLDRITESSGKVFLEDDDGFMHFSEYGCPTQRCLKKMTTLGSSAAVLATVYRELGCPYRAMQHIALETDVDEKNDPRMLSGSSRLQWESNRSFFRLYAMGVSQTSVPRSRFVVDPHCSATQPLFRNTVNDFSDSPTVLVAANGVIAHPSLLSAISDALQRADIVFVAAPTTLCADWTQVAVEIAAPGKPILDDAMSMAIVAFRRQWWEENEAYLPHGLLMAGNYLDCLHQMVSARHSDVPVIQGHVRMLSRDDSGSEIDQHNTRVTSAVLKLVSQGFMQLGDIHTSRRKLRIEPKYSWQHHYQGASTIQQLERLESSHGVLFNPVVDPSFSYAPVENIPYAEPWTGIVHGVFDYPDHLPRPEHSLAHILQSPDFIASLPWCRGIFTYTEYLRRRIIHSGLWPRDIPINVVPHTSITPNAYFQAPRFIHCPEREIYSIGYYGKCLSSFIDFDGGKYAKILLAPMSKDVFYQYLDSEKSIALTEFDVEIKKRVSNVEYDRILSQSLVFLDYYDLSASNILTECIVRNVPMLVRRHPAVVEQLGEDYPLYFDGLDTASAKLVDDLILDAHAYLANIDNRGFFHQAFYDAIVSSEIYRDLC